MQPTTSPRRWSASASTSITSSTPPRVAELRAGQQRHQVDQRAAALPHALRLPARAQPADPGQSAVPAASTRLEAFAALLNAATRPFHVINYVGSLCGGRALGRSGMGRLMDLVVRRPTSVRARRRRGALNRDMHFPVGWDPYFRDYMTLRDVFHYPTQHYDHHRRQLTFDRSVRSNRPTTRPGPAGEGEAELGIALKDPTWLPSRGSPDVATAGRATGSQRQHGSHRHPRRPAADRPADDGARHDALRASLGVG